MPQVAPATDHYRAQFDALEAQGALGRPAWLRERRRAALDRFVRAGFPTTRDEDWRYTNVAPVAAAPFRVVADGAPAAPPAELLERFTFARDWPRLVFVGGRWSPALSAVGALPSGVRVGSLAEVLAADPALLERYLAAPGANEGDAFVALNAALALDGAVVHVPAGVTLEAPVHLLFVGPPAGAAALPRTLVVAGPESRVTVVESHVGLTGEPYLTDALTEVVAEAGAQVTHYTVGREGARAFHVGTLWVRQERDSRVGACAVTLGGALVRNTVRVLLDGPGAECALDGFYMVGAGEHVDNHVTVDHARPRGTSRQFYKGILDGAGRAVFNGRILVRRDAQRTDADQTNKNLLLADGAEVDSKPQLEIYADDVRCTHGAAEGQLAGDALFYLQSRGLGEAAARTLLAYGFANEVLQRIALGPIRAELDGLVLGRLRAVLAAKERP